jgi:hypothetical protein
MSLQLQLLNNIGKEANISLWDRVKVVIWNFILPPHLRLALLDITEPEKEYNIPLDNRSAVVEVSGRQDWSPDQKGNSIVVEPILMVKDRTGQL